MKNKNYLLEPTSIVDPGAVIGSGTKIWHNCHITKTAIVGRDCNIGKNCFVAGKIGNGCKLQNNVNIYDGVELGDWVFCGPSMTFTNDINPRAKYPKNGRNIRTFVEEGVSLGANCTIICGVKLGAWAFIGAGTVVTRDVPAYAVSYGNPAKVKGWICECGEKLPEKFTKTACLTCHRRYSREENKVKEIR